jgi:hypothetical protein
MPRPLLSAIILVKIQPTAEGPMREIKPYPIVDKLINVFDSWLKHRQEIRELREFDIGEFARIAHELCVTPDDLDTLVRRGPDAIEELPKLLAALGIDEKAIARTLPLVLRDMERVCASCQHKRQCDHDIAAGTSGQHYEEYCDNAATINSLG